MTEHVPAMTPEEFASRMKGLVMDADPEGEHRDMDELMCRLLESLGYEEGVKVFEDATKWYA